MPERPQDAATKPVLKWAGSKRRLAARIAEKLPERIDTYYEPFLGSAAVFFYLAANGRFERAVLGDANAALMDVYQALKCDVQQLIRALRTERFQTLGEDAYYRVRALEPKNLDLFERAARTIYLNRTGYNGLYRVNRTGAFNVPFGRYTRPRICMPERLEAAARALTKAELFSVDFQELTRRAKPGDAVYFDPPYVPVSRTSYFTAYSKDAFGEPEHDRLAAEFEKLCQRSVPAVLSNSDTPLTRELYQNWNVDHIVVSRPINSDASKRGPVGELLVVNERKKTHATERAKA